MNKILAQKLLEKVKADYDAGSEPFSRRSKLWLGTARLVREQVDVTMPTSPTGRQAGRQGCKVLDVGCGDGRWLEVLEEKGVDYVGVDNSEELIKIAKRKFSDIRYPTSDFRIGDILDLPFGDDEFDVVLCIAVLHHVPSRELREKAMREMCRVLKPGGKLVMTNWNLSCEVYKFRHISSFIVSLFHCFIVDRGNKGGCLGFRDLMIPWGITGNKIKRYCYAFSLSELARLVKRAGFRVDVKYYTDKKKKSSFQKSFWKRGNMVVVATKK